MAEMVRVVRVMPDPSYARLWDSILVDASIKERLLRATALNLRLRAQLPFEDDGPARAHPAAWPPGNGQDDTGTGAGARVGQRSPKAASARLVEVNPHGLMSAEHGESQRAVTQLLTEYVPSLGDDGMPTVVLLDEVESMAVARE